MPNIAKPFCDKHNIEKFKDKANRNICGLCRYEKKKIYTERNKEIIKKKNQEYSKKTRSRAKAWLEEDRKMNPERYRNYAAKYHELNAEIRTTIKIIKKYGLSLEEYKKMVNDCDNRCSICKDYEKSLFQGKIRRLCLDHCHETGKIRGLVCFSCNIGLGKFEDNIHRLQAAIDYLKRHE
jgi:hypothetical protein